MLFDTAGWVHPAHRGRGFGTAFVLVVEGRAVRDLGDVPTGSAPRVLQSFDADASGAHDPDASGARALLEELGYSPEREYLHMEIDVPDGFDLGDAPAGITIRPRVQSDDRAIVAVMAKGFQDPWDYEEAQQEWVRAGAREAAVIQTFAPSRLAEMAPNAYTSGYPSAAIPRTERLRPLRNVLDKVEERRLILLRGQEIQEEHTVVARRSSCTPGGSRYPVSLP
jgi:hypothetical protein